MASAAAPRHGRAPDLPRVRPVIASPDPEPDGLVSVGSLLRREGRRAAHAVDRPLVPRARDLLEAGTRTSTHRAAVAAGALLAVTTVLGSSALGDGTIISGVGVDEAADAGPAAVPPPAEPLTLAAADAPVRQVMAALQSAGTPVRAVLVDGPIGAGPPGSGTVSGAGIVAAALDAPAVTEGTTRSGSSSSDDDRGADDRSDDSRRDSDRDSSRKSTNDSSRDSDRDDRDSGSDDGAPSRPVVPLPSADPDLPPPVTGSDIVDGSLGGSGSAPDGNIDGGSAGGSDGDTAGDTGTRADGEDQDAGGDDSSADDNSSDDAASDGDTSSGDNSSGDTASGADAA